MPTQENPTLYVEYGLDGVNYTSLLNKVEKFNVKDSGINKLAQAEVTLWNKNGYFTGTNPPLQNNAWLRIRADTGRGAIDTMFLGKTKIGDSKSDNKKEHLTITARGRINALVDDFKTYKYNDDILNSVHQWNVLEALQDATTHPDSGRNVNIGINAFGSGNIATALMKQNFDRRSLLDVIQSGCEYCGYAGWDDYSTTPNLHLEPIGTTLTNPLIEIPAEPLERECKIDIDNLYTTVLVWPAPQTYFPAKDWFCEGGYAQGFWNAGTNSTVSDDSTLYYYGSKSIKIYGANTLKNAIGNLDLTQVVAGGVNFQTFMMIDMYLPFYAQTDSTTRNMDLWIKLTDTQGYTLTYILRSNSLNKWNTPTIPIGSINTSGTYQLPTTELMSSSPDSNVWLAVAGQTFNWIVTTITFTFQAPVAGTSYAQGNIDSLYFDCAVPTDPTVNTSLQASDPAMIGLWGENVLELDEPELADYMNIPTYARDILNIVKNPITQLKVKIAGSPWARPAQVVHVASMPAYVIWDSTISNGASIGYYGAYTALTNWYGRIVDLEHDYDASTKMLHTTLTLTPRYQPVTSKEWYRGMLDGVILYRQW